MPAVGTTIGTVITYTPSAGYVTYTNYACQTATQTNTIVVAAADVTGTIQIVAPTASSTTTSTHFYTGRTTTSVVSYPTDCSLAVEDLFLPGCPAGMAQYGLYVNGVAVVSTQDGTLGTEADRSNSSIWAPQCLDHTGGFYSAYYSSRGQPFGAMNAGESIDWGNLGPQYICTVTTGMLQCTSTTASSNDWYLCQPNSDEKEPQLVLGAQASAKYPSGACTIVQVQAVPLPS